MKRLLRLIAGVTCVAGLYIIVGIVIHTYIFPQTKPDLNSYFEPGDKVVSRFEGFDQTVLSVGDGYLHTRLEVKPHAAGPPEHFHENFAETFTVKSGTLSIMFNGEKRSLKAGETLFIPPMTRHKPFNETDEIVIVEGDDPKAIPVEFGFVLTQLYGFMDGFPNGPSTPQMLMQLSVYGSDADSWLADGPPLPLQKAMRFVMAPTARLAGYQYYDEEFRPKR